MKTLTSYSAQQQDKLKKKTLATTRAEICSLAAIQTGHSLFLTIRGYCRLTFLLHAFENL